MSARTRGSTALAALVRKLDIVAPLTAVEKDLLLELPCTVRNLPARQDIVAFGERPTQCCLVLQGWVYRYAFLSGGGRQIMAFYVPGDIPDLQSLHLHVMDHSLASLTPCTLAFFAHDSVRALMRDHPSVAAALWRDSLIDASQQRERITSLGRRKAIGRVAHLFCEMYLRQRAVGLASGMSCPMPPRQTELADALGLTSVHLNRVLRTLRTRQLVTLNGGILTIGDWEGLVREAEFEPTYLHQTNNRLAEELVEA